MATKYAVASLVMACLAMMTGGATTSPAPPDAEDVKDIPSRQLFAGQDQNKRYFLIGPRPGGPPPSAGYRLLVVLPGGDGGEGFHPFVKRILKRSLPGNYLVVQLVAATWDPQQAKRLVWPTRGAPWQGMKFSTEEFVEAMVADVARTHRLDPRYVFILGWSSAGPACYAVSLQTKTAVTGSFIAMSVFKPDQYPPLENAKGRAFFLLHSLQDFIPIRMAEQAAKSLQEAGARTRLTTYQGGHGWRGDVFGNIRSGIQWLERNSAAGGAASPATRPGTQPAGAEPATRPATTRTSSSWTQQDGAP